MNYIRLVLSSLATNCYIVPTGAFVDVEITDDGEQKTVKREAAVVIDPADNAGRIIAEAERAELFVNCILLTHGHFDHTGAVSGLKEEYGAPVYIFKDDADMLSDPETSLSFFTPERAFVSCEADELLNDGDCLSIGALKFTVLHTPGHTAGSVCYLCNNTESGEKLMFSGDTLFKDSIGRSDVYSSAPSEMQRSLDKLAALPDDYIVLPGHGEPTVLSAEKRFNPFLAGI